MRILVLTFYYAPDLCAGSFRATAFVEQLKKYVTKDDTVDIITTKPNRYGSFTEDSEDFEKLDQNIFLHRLDLGTHKSGFIDQSILFLKFAWKTYRLVKKKKRYDIVFATSSRLMTAFLGSLISNRQHTKFYLDMRDIFTDTLESLFAHSVLRYCIPFFKYIEKYTVNSANQINLVSKGFEEYYKKIRGDLVYSFYTNGIDELFLHYDFTKEVSSDKIIITYAGNIGEGQGLEKIVPDMARSLGTAYEIRLIGDGGRKLALANALNGIDNVKLYGPVNRKELLVFYKNSDILFLHLNDFEAFKKVLPSKVFEYACTDKLILAGVTGYAKEFIEENVSGSVVFNPCDIVDFNKQFKKLSSANRLDRSEFIDRYRRDNIMKKLAQEVYAL